MKKLKSLNCSKGLFGILLPPSFLTMTSLIHALNPDAPSFIPASQYIYRSKNGDLWSPARGWLKSYRCQACKIVMSRKDGRKFPQQIKKCGHITCAKCIVTSYTMCPVKDCGIDLTNEH